ncbi:alpha/beta fold hydrolase [Streptomyces sp. AHA2]|uniref:alpha/beta fold hydrolase n=1 Tax=Streptomyces sp. AHA2 TaxID=3064526 RepID=UPI002FE0956D
MTVGIYAFACPPSLAHAHGQLSEPCESGHFGHIEQPDEFVAIVSDFVNNQEMGKQT